MNRKIIKRLAEDSYFKKALDRKKVYAIAKALKRRDLREYIRILRNFEERASVNVTLPRVNEMSEIRQKLAKIYPGKRIVFTIDPTILAGIRVVDYDDVYEMSLKNFLESELNQIANRYD